MEKYLKKFENHTDYETYINGQDVILPNVSLCEQQNEVHYNPIDPYGGHDYVEIGGKKWATMNIGANSATDTGLYFAWGDTDEYTQGQGWAEYKYCSGAGTVYSAMTKYNSTDGKTVLESSDDAATVNWGGNWRMPTIEELQALGAATNSAWTNDYQGSGVSGLVLTDKTDNSKVLFLPSDSYNRYWSSSLDSSNVTTAYIIFFSRYTINYSNSLNRCNGYLIRPVAD